MEDLNQSVQQTPIPSAERPTAATVFGILGIVLGALGLICPPIVFGLSAIMQAIKLPAMPENVEVTEINKVWQIVAAFAGIGFSIWLLVTGIGLLKLKRWARRSAIIYSYLNIIWVLISVGMIIADFSQDWTKFSQTTEYSTTISIPGDIIVGTCCSLGALIFPILLLIFMQTAKVKQSFAQLEAGKV